MQKPSSLGRFRSLELNLILPGNSLTNSGSRPKDSRIDHLRINTATTCANGARCKGGIAAENRGRERSAVD